MMLGIFTLILVSANETCHWCKYMCVIIVVITEGSAGFFGGSFDKNICKCLIADAPFQLFVCPLPITIEMPSKKSKLSQSVLENLEGSDAICIITRESMDLILNNNTKLQQQMLELQKATVQLNNNVVNNLNRLADIMESMTTHATNSTANLDSKLDKLIEVVSRNNVKATAVTDIDDLFNKRKDLIGQRVRNEKLSKYYEELLTQDRPFVRREFRTHVSKTTSESVLEIRRKQAINTVEVEISVLHDQLSSCTEKQRKLDENISKYFQEMDEAETHKIKERMNEQEQKIADGYEKTKLAFFKKFDENEKATITEYLLKITDDKDRNQGPKNYWGQNRRRPPRRGSYMNR